MTLVPALALASPATRPEPVIVRHLVHYGVERPLLARLRGRGGGPRVPAPLLA